MSCTATVVIPAFNSATTLPRAIVSALGQDIHDIEILIVNDGSSDQTGAVATGFTTDSRVRVITFGENHGKAHAMNIAIEQACGRWIAVLDADDWYASHRLSTLINAGEVAQVPIVADNQNLYDEGADEVIGSALPVDARHRVLDKSAFIAGCDPYSPFDFGMLKPVVRTDFIRSERLHYRERARLSEDFFYLLDAFIAGGSMLLIGRPLYYWRQAFGSVSRRWTGTAHGNWRYDFPSAVSVSAALLPELRARGEHACAALVRRRMRAFRRLHRMQEVSRLRAEGTTLLHLVASLLCRPSIWLLVMQRGIARIFRQVGTCSPLRAQRFNSSNAD
jgi:succinoglycan biosynthesis protein ExoO